MSALLAGRLEVVATSYDLLRLHANQLTKTQFEAVLFDEYHTIKSASALVSKAACELKTKRVFGLTGTLMQNDMKELWFLAHLIDPLAVGEQVRSSGRATAHAVCHRAPIDYGVGQCIIESPAAFQRRGLCGMYSSTRRNLLRHAFLR